MRSKTQEHNRKLRAVIEGEGLGPSKWRQRDCVTLDAGTASCRKLSVTVNLSDPNEYRGGSLKLGAVGQPEAAELRARGSMLVFPSFVEHGVTPLLAGQRYSLVAWFSGPNWR